ncbi:hypothetical protein AB1Y20_016690 [Prymnesium parvum]|uniref:Uncharacterized protein n=1 Tax=Prymnesium parvum TaxID=97485 RepID=A0AB34IEA1_PRYPA
MCHVHLPAVLTQYPACARRLGMCAHSSSVVMVGLLALLCTPPSVRAASPHTGRRPALRLRGGAVWVKAPDERKLQIVHSLSKFCEEHELDEEAMRAVAAGEARDHNGWDCGEVCEYDSPQKAEEVGTSAGEESEASGEREAAAMPPINQMLWKMGLPFVANQLLKRADKDSPLYVPCLRAAYCGSVLTNLAVQALLHWRVAAANDTSIVAAPADPVSLLLGGKANAPQTVAEYDRKQLRAMRSSLQMGVIITLVLHLKFRMTQPLIYQAISSLVELYFHPLVQVHLLGIAAQGALKRPFGSVRPDMTAMLKGLTESSKQAAQSSLPRTVEND